MNNFRRQGIIFILLLSALFCGEARADFYFQQDVHCAQKGVREEQSKPSERDFRRKIYVLGQVLVIQIEEGGALKKEYGFDLSKNLYYEADPSKDYFKLFNLKVLDEAFLKMGLQAQESFRDSRGGMAKDLSRGLLEGKTDYPVSIRPAYFAKREFDGHPAKLYKLRAGPGTVFLNFFGWYRKADIWTATDLPGIPEYETFRLALGKKAAFYKIKHNQVSDLITTLPSLKGVPLRIDSVAKRTYERTTSKETSREITSLISNSPVKTDRLLYYKDKSRFSWNVLFSKGTEFGPEVSMARGEAFDIRRSMPWFLIPVLFFVLTYLWFLGGYMELDEFSLHRFVILRVYALVSVLFALEIIHYIHDLPFLLSPLFEFALLGVLGAVWIGWEVRTHLLDIEKRMRESQLRFCPHCGARCELFYIVCPKCNRPLDRPASL